MMIAVILITTLMLGFVLGRIWEIRHQIVLAEPRSARRRPVEGSVKAQVSEQAQADNRRLLAALDQISDVVSASASAQDRRSNVTVRGLRIAPYARNS